MNPNPSGIRDPVVPVIKVDRPDGTLRGLLFGCACHNTTLTDKHNLICGDYAGFAQQFLEENHPGVTAQFLIGCGADANPEPRGEMGMARDHGRELANQVEKVISSALKPVEGPLRMAYQIQNLPLKNHEEDLNYWELTLLRSLNGEADAFGNRFGRISLGVSSSICGLAFRGASRWSDCPASRLRVRFPAQKGRRPNL
jgi:hypothetical protein